MQGLNWRTWKDTGMTKKKEIGGGRVRKRERDKLISDLKWQFVVTFCRRNATRIKKRINKGCREDIRLLQVIEATEWGGERWGEQKQGGREWTVWTFLATFPWPLQTLDLTSHVIRGCVNQQLGAQMKGCQLLPGAQQATEHSSRVRIPYVYSDIHTHKCRHTIEQLMIWQENTAACLN